MNEKRKKRSHHCQRSWPAPMKELDRWDPDPLAVHYCGHPPMPLPLQPLRHWWSQQITNLHQVMPHLFLGLMHSMQVEAFSSMDFAWCLVSSSGADQVEKMSDRQFVRSRKSLRNNSNKWERTQINQTLSLDQGNHAHTPLPKIEKLESTLAQQSHLHVHESWLIQTFIGSGVSGKKDAGRDSIAMAQIMYHG